MDDCRCVHGAVIGCLTLEIGMLVRFAPRWPGQSCPLRVRLCMRIAGRPSQYLGSRSESMPTTIGWLHIRKGGCGDCPMSRLYSFRMKARVGVCSACFISNVLVGISWCICTIFSSYFALQGFSFFIFCGTKLPSLQGLQERKAACISMLL